MDPLLKAPYARFLLWVYINTGEPSAALAAARVPFNLRIWQAMSMLTRPVKPQADKAWRSNHCVVR